MLNHAPWIPTASEIKTGLTSTACTHLHLGPLLPPIISSEAFSQTRSTNPFLPGLFLGMESHSAAKNSCSSCLYLLSVEITGHTTTLGCVVLGIQAMTACLLGKHSTI